MGWMPGCPADPGVFHGALAPAAVVLHRTYGAWGGDYSVGTQGIFHFLLGKAEGRWAQFAPTEVVQYHCNGANFRAVGIEIEGTNEDDLTAWQSDRLGDVLRWLNAEHGIPLTYLDPFTVAPASVRVNGSSFTGAIAHRSVATDDGSSQHTDLITVDAYNAAVGAPPPAPNPYREDLMAADHFETSPYDRSQIWWFSGAGRRWVSGSEWQIIQTDAALKGLPAPKPFAGTAESFQRVPDVTTFVG